LPLSAHTDFDLLELIRTDLLEFLWHLAFGPYPDREAREENAEGIQLIADRLKELTPIMARHLRGRMQPDEPFEPTENAPYMPWFELETYWEDRQRQRAAQ
jgi:hypothetical protein